MQNSHHMTADEFRKKGYEVIDWIASYMETVGEYPVLSQNVPGDVRASLPSSPPESGEAFAEVMKDLNEIIMPGITHWQSPNFFAFFPANSSGPSILADMISSGLGVQGMLWATSPACTELETHVLDWLVDMLGLPEDFSSRGSGGGVIQDSASSATLTAMIVARERTSDYATQDVGISKTMTIYTSDQAHSSVEKAAMIAGLGRQQVRLIASDENFAMRPDALAAAIAADIEAGLQPFFVSATVGTTSSNGMDPLKEIGVICQRHSLWLHVDAAMSGTAAICPEFRWIHDGMELVDSYCFNPHKWMFTNFDCDAFYVRDRKALIRSLSILPEYLKNKATESGAVIDYRDWQIPLGRRFRALKLWFVIRHYGVKGLQEHIREHIRLAKLLARWIREDDSFDLYVEPPLNLVCFRFRGSDEENLAIMEECNASGELYFTHTKLNDQVVLRFSIGGTWTTESAVTSAWERIIDVARKLA